MMEHVVPYATCLSKRQTRNGHYQRRAASDTSLRVPIDLMDDLTTAQTANVLKLRLLDEFANRRERRVQGGAAFVTQPPGKNDGKLLCLLAFISFYLLFFLL
ncbi:hypothetical protein NPIL_228531 [Nephila pilipes]|uniref:Uncharacterized protein n=1 Tax=Nephila pilipes TaxID=299642 RepID=A0A8X6PJ60_NEPPI|nr:hypothetical protein NPIL_228531 [Nephila pilipes]